MKPFTALPPKVLASLLAFVTAAAVFTCLWPMAAAIVAAVAIAATLAGGWMVWREASLGPASLLPDGAVRSALVPAGCAAVILVMMAAPGLYFKDGGELAASAHGLGVPHPTGFPVFVLAGKFMDSLPVAGTFFRLNLASALAMAMAGAAVFLIALVLADPGGCGNTGWGTGLPAARMAVSAVAGPGSFLAAHHVWLHGTTTEVYAVSAAGMGIALLLFAAAARSGDARMVVAAWFVTGLGLGGHVTWWGLSTLFGMISTAAWARVEGTRRVPVLVSSLSAALLGALVVLYLPVAASRDPLMNWGDPSTFQGLIDHLSAARIRASFAWDVGAFNRAWLEVHARLAAGVLWEACGPVLPLALAGLWAVARKAPLMAFAVGLLVAADFLYAIAINPMGVRDLQTGVPALFAVSVLCSAGAGWLWDLASKRGPGVSRHLFAACVCALVAIQAWTAPADRVMAGVTAPAEVAGGILAGAGPAAIVLTSSDDLSAGTAALQAVEGMRPDVLVLVRQHIADSRCVGRRFRASMLPGDEGLRSEVAARPFEAGGEDPGEAFRRLLRLVSTRGEVLVEPGEGRWDHDRLGRASPGFPTWRLDGGGKTQAIQQAMRYASGCDRWGLEFLAGGLRLLGTALAKTGRSPEAMEALGAAIGLVSSDSKSLHNLGLLLFENGRREQGLALIRRAVESDPGYVHGWRTLEKYASMQGLSAEAAEAGERARALAR